MNDVFALDFTFCLEIHYIYRFNRCTSIYLSSLYNDAISPIFLEGTRLFSTIATRYAVVELVLYCEMIVTYYIHHIPLILHCNGHPF